MKTQAQLALRENDAAAMRAIVASIAATTDATVHLANRLLTLARIEHGGEAAALEPVALAGVVRQVALELALPAVQKPIDLSLDVDGAPLVDGQALLLHELVSNLVDNAIRYTPAGGTVALRVRALASGARLEIEDSGAGIAAGERDKVFRPFYRSVSTMADNQGGTGLGLAIVRDIAVLHGATIELGDGAGGVGPHVSIAFPLSKEQDKQQESELLDKR
ncbi:MAG: sensor histidine kinase [Massilia sp.]|nr:sensor histidine kinase [Massilia sp.]